MTEPIHSADPDEAVYKFRFGTSDKVVQVTHQELLRIPYLFALVTHKDAFLSTQNKSGEYAWFMLIFLSITSKEPYILFDKLSEDADVISMLQLYDYLGVESFPLPLLEKNAYVFIGCHHDRISWKMC